MKLTLARLVAALTFISIFAMAARVSVDTDTWWHLRTGQWILQHSALPVADPFSFTRAGAEWNIPGWAVQVPMFWLFDRFGYVGLNLFTAFFVTLAFVFIYLTCDGHPLLRAFTLVLAAAASAIYWSARPQIVSFALAAVFAYVLYLYRWRGVNRLWALVPLMTLWANAHGGFAIGFILIGLTFAGQLASFLWRAATRESDLKSGDVDGRGLAWLAGVGLACALAVAVNPSGPAMLLYPFKTVSIGALRDFIQEWQSPNFHLKEAQPFLWLLLATFGAAGLSGRRMNFTDFALVAGTAYLGFLAGRNVALLAIVAPPVLSRHAARALDDLRARFPARPAQRREIPDRLAVSLNWLLLAIAVCAVILKVLVIAQPEVNERALRRSEPVGAVEYLRRERPLGPMFNSYNWGGYLMWALPEYPVYVDGRTDLYSDAFLREYLQAAAGRAGWPAILERYGVKLILVEAESGLAQNAARSGDWREVYRDAMAVILVGGRP